MTDKSATPLTDAAAAAAATPKASTRPAAPAEKQAVLTELVGDIVPGRIVRGPSPEVEALIAAGKARLASPDDLGIAGGRTVRLPKPRKA